MEQQTRSIDFLPSGLDPMDEAFTLVKAQEGIMFWIEADDGSAVLTRDQFETMVRTARELMEWEQPK